MRLFLLLSLVSLAGAATRNKNALSHDLTLDLDSKMTCFWEELTAGDKLQTSVMTMEDRKTHIQLRVTSPSGDLSDWESGDRSARLVYNLTESGIYEFCIHSSVKTRVAFYIFAYNEDTIVKGVSEYTQMERTGQALSKSVVTLNERLYQTLHSIKYSSLSMARDERLQKKNAEYIKQYTIVFIALNVVIAIVQIAVIRRFFREGAPGKIRI